MMNLLKNITILVFMLAAVISCKKDNNSLDELNNIPAPANLAVQFDITQDNTGLVTVLPNSEGATRYLVTFGDVGGEVPAEYGLNEAITHIYGEGVYKVGVTALGLTGLSSSVENEINVTFKAPENLVVIIEQDAVNPKTIHVTATAEYATIMDIYFGDVPDEEPVHALPEEVVSHTYAEAGDYVVKVIAKSGGAATTEFTQTVTISPASDPVELPITFESYTVNYAFENFGNATSTVIDNPDPSGIDVSERVAQFVKAAGAETWAGSLLTLGNPIDFSNNKLFKMKVWSPKSGAIVKLKVENLTNGDISAEVDALTTVSNEWEELSFDFSSIDVNNQYQKIVFFFDFDVPGDDATYYFDDVKLVPANVPSTKMIENFEGPVPTFTDFGNIAPTVVVANPDQSAVNPTANTAQFTKSAGAETWGGTFFEPGEPLDFDNFGKINMKTWSPKSGIIVKLKIENQDASVTYEVDVVNSVANAWEDLVYDFSNAPPAVYVRIVVFFDFDVPGDGTVYYFDQIELANDGGGPSPVSVFQDFEGTPPVFTAFGNIPNIEVVPNPDMSGDNTTANTAKMVKSAGSETWAGAFFETSPLDLVTYSKLQVKIWSPKSGIIIKAKLENQDASITHEVDITNSTANAWETLNYDFSDAPAASYVRVVIFFDFDVPGDDSIYYYDQYALTN